MPVMDDLGIGLGLRSVHYPSILADWPAVDWFEILSENYMQTRGRPLQVLDRIAERYPIVMHGVSLSIGSVDPLDREYLRELRALSTRTRARCISDHLCFTGVHGHNTHDLLPLPYTEEALAHVARRVREVQDFLEAPLVLENPSSYVEFSASTLSEWQFLAALADETGCGLLLDVNNVYVSSVNHGFDAHAYLDALPADRIAYVHVAGHTRHVVGGAEHAEGQSHLVDTHIGPVPDPVWSLLAYARSTLGPRSVLLEWDAEIPSFAEVHADALRAHRVLSPGAA